MARVKTEAVKLDIYNKIRTEIISGRKKPGERISMDLLKDEFGTSVSPVRDALQKLSQEDLVTIKPRSGYYVSRVTLKELRDLLEMREILELAAVVKAAEKITPEQIRALETIHAGYTDDRDETYSRYTLENKEFHTLVARASGNDELARQVSRVHDRMARFMIIVRSGHYMIDIHKRLLDRLAARDAAGAKKTLKKELDQAKTAIMDRIMEEESDGWHLRTAGG